MQKNPIADKLNEPVATSLEYSLSRLRAIFRVPRNFDVIIRRIIIAGFPAAILYLDGMINAENLNLNVLRPGMEAPVYTGDPSGRAQWLAGEVLTVCELKLTEALDEVVGAVLSGDAALLLDGCPLAIMIDVKGFQKRGVEKPINETAVTGPHEAFNESMKVNLTLLRRIVKSPRLVAEEHPLGTGIHTGCSLMYLDGVANEDMLTEVRRRLSMINLDYVMTAGELEQLIEDSPYALVPQVVHTERPDRAASFLISGMALILVDGTPGIIGVPASLYQFIQTPDMSTMRFPLGSFKRLIVTFGILITMLMPGIYLSLVMFHTEVLPLALLSSIYETQSRVPIPIVLELVFLSLGFDLILEAGARMPGVLSSGLGAISALILGQAVIQADLISPLLIVVVAISGLGALLLPEHNLTLGLRLLQSYLIAITAIAGIYGLMLALFYAGMELCCQTSMGIPLLRQSTPGRIHDPDNIGRYPLWQQRIRMYLVQPGQLLRAFGRVRVWDRKGNRHE